MTGKRQGGRKAGRRGRRRESSATLLLVWWLQLNKLGQPCGRTVDLLRSKPDTTFPLGVPPLKLVSTNTCQNQTPLGYSDSPFTSLSAEILFVHS